MDRFWRVNYATPSAIDAGYNDDLEFFFKELGKTYLALWQAWTVGRHVSRHYLDIFTDHCKHCRGAGIIICPHCNGFKTKKTRPAVFKLSLMTTVNNLYPKPDATECFHCGGYTLWDQQHKWEMLTAVKEVEEELASGCFTEPDRRFTASTVDEEAANDRKFDAEQYITGTGDTDFAGWYTGDENGEVKPRRLHFSEWVHNHPEYYDDVEPEIVSDMINANITAAAADRPKPYMFEPTAGTVPCPNCNGESWYWTLEPNLDKLGGYRLPFWYNTLQRMGQYWAHPDDQPRSRQRDYMEYTRTYDPPALRFLGTPSLSSQHAGGPVGLQWDSAKDVERKELLVHYIRNFDEVTKDMEPDEKERLKEQLFAEMHDMDREGFEAPDRQELGRGSDPLSSDPEKFLDTEELINMHYSKHPLTGVPPVFYKWLFGPPTPREDAAMLRDIRDVQNAKNTQERMQVLKELSHKWRWQEQLNAPIEQGLSSEEVLGGLASVPGRRFSIQPDPLDDPELRAAGVLPRAR